MIRHEPRLAERLTDLIGREGPISVARYMALCLHDRDYGYYATRPDLGPGGDFITAPLVSQMFGELIGLWAAQTWSLMGRPARFRLVELGPGHGVMMADMLRAARVAPRFRESCEVWLVETSAPLRARQAESLAGLATPTWAANIEAIPTDAPVILVANEFLDCLPIDQAIRHVGAWRDRVVAIGSDGRLTLAPGGLSARPGLPSEAPEGIVAEWSAELEAVGRAVGSLIAGTGGAALFIDYGRESPGFGDTLQALRRHRKESPLARPGEADLTAHVDFPAFLAAARRGGATTQGVVPQGAFLGVLGVQARAAALAGANPRQAKVIARQLDRLIGARQMGELFKVAALVAPVLAARGFRAPGFEADR